MTRPHLARLATDLLASEPASPCPPAHGAEARAIVALAARLRMRARRRRAARVVGAVALAAAMVLGIGQAMKMRSATLPSHGAPAPTQPAEPTTASAVEPGGGSTLVRATVTSRLEPNAPLAPGDRVRTGASGPSSIVLSDTSHLRVERDAELVVTALSSTRAFLLEKGELRADVHRLAPGERFVVSTIDAEIEVHGTSFRVAVAPKSATCAATLTRVHVFEGIVAVRFAGHEERLFAGEDWPRECPETPTAAASVPPQEASVSPRPVGAPIAAPTHSARPASPVPLTESVPKPPGALAEQNQLFAEATAARRIGDHAAALAAYDRILARHPDGFFAETAMVERMRTLADVDPPRARVAAAAYLARYPSGFARADAERLIR